MVSCCPVGLMLPNTTQVPATVSGNLPLLFMTRTWRVGAAGGSITAPFAVGTDRTMLYQLLSGAALAAPTPPALTMYASLNPGIPLGFGAAIPATIVFLLQETSKADH